MTPKNKNTSKGAGTMAAKKTTPLPKSITDQDNPPTMQAIAEGIAKTYQGKVLRQYVIGNKLVILLADGRKYYVQLEG